MKEIFREIIDGPGFWELEEAFFEENKVIAFKLNKALHEAISKKSNFILKRLESLDDKNENWSFVVYSLDTKKRYEGEYSTETKKGKLFLIQTRKVP